MMEAMEFPEELQLTMDNLEVNSNPMVLEHMKEEIGLPI